MAAYHGGSLISAEVRKKPWVMYVGMRLGNNGVRVVTAVGQARGDEVWINDVSV